MEVGWAGTDEWGPHGWGLHHASPHPLSLLWAGMESPSAAFPSLLAATCGVRSDLAETLEHLAGPGSGLLRSRRVWSKGGCSWLPLHRLSVVSWNMGCSRDRLATRPSPATADFLFHSKSEPRLLSPRWVF